MPMIQVPVDREALSVWCGPAGRAGPSMAVIEGNGRQSLQFARSGTCGQVRIAPVPGAPVAWSQAEFRGMPARQCLACAISGADELVTCDRGEA